MLSPSDLGDLLQFVSATARPDVRRSALAHLLGTTGSKEGAAEFERDGAQLAVALATLAVAGDSVPDSDKRSALQALTNACAESDTVARLLAGDEAGRRLLLLSDTAPPLCADRCRLVVNVTACQRACEALFNDAALGDAEVGRCLAHWVDSFVSPTCAHWSLCGAAVMNGTAVPRIRRSLCDGDASQLSRIAAVVTAKDDSATARRRLALAIVRNCCFDTDLHSSLLRDNSVLLSLLYPVAAGDMRIADAEMDDLMTELQYLPADKKREPDAELRTTVLEAIYQLCATRCGRERCRAAGAYYVLREWHKVEVEPTLDKLLYDLINVLIRNEDEMGADNLKEVPLDDVDEEKEKR